MKFGIAARLGLALTLVAIISGGTTGFITYRDSRDRLVEEAQQRLIATATVAARRLSVTLEQAGREVLFLSSDPDAAGLLAAAPERAPSPWQSHYADDLASNFQRLMALNPHFAEIRLIDRDDFGLERIRVVRDENAQPQRVADAELREKGHLEYVSHGLTIPAGTLFGSPLTLRRAGGAQEGLGDPTLIITAAVADRQGKTLGLVVLNLRLDALFQDIVRDLPPYHALYLTNRLGDYLLHPDPNKAFAFERGQQARVQDEFPQAARLLDHQGLREPVLVEPDDDQGGRVAVFIRQEVAGSVSGAGFIFGLAQPVGELMKASSALTTRVGQVMLIFSAAALALAMLIARAMTRPLREMAHAVQHFSECGEKLSLPIERNDEIGFLARAASAAQHRIADTLAALEGKRSELAHLARHDPLTGIANRRLFAERAEMALARANRSGQMLAVLLIDLDDFKPVNDRFGHAAGDAVLVAVASRLQALVRETDTVARIGGDEFAILLEAIEDREHIEPVVRKLLDEIVKAVPWDEGELRVGASIGIKVFPDGNDSLDSLMSGADQAMYRAKTGGGARFAFFED